VTALGIAIAIALVVAFVAGFKVGVAYARTYRCQRCGEWDAEQERIDRDEERFDREGRP
jgi:hypothetical protein